MWVIDGTAPIDPNETLGDLGIAFERRPPPRHVTSSMGVRARVRGGRLVVDAVLRGRAAMRAGIDAGDEILAVAGRRVDDGLEQALTKLPANEPVEVLVVREGVVMTKHVTLDGPPPGDGRLCVRPDATPSQLALAEAWLGAGALAPPPGAP